MMRILSVCCLCLVAACGPDPTLISHESAFALAADASGLYWWRIGPEALRASTPLGAPGRTLLALPEAFPARLLLSAGEVIFAGNVYASRPQSLIAVPKSGGAPRTLASSDLLGDPAVDSDFLYFFDPGKPGIFRTPLVGAGPTTRISDAIAEAIVIDQGFLYFSSLNPPHIARAPTTGGPAETLIDGESAPLLLVDDGHLYWPGTYSRIRTMPKTGGTPSDLISFSRRTRMTALAVDAASVWCLCDDATDYDPPPSHGDLVRIPKDGSAFKTVVPNITDSYALAVREGDVFWSDPKGIHHLAMK